MTFRTLRELAYTAKLHRGDRFLVPGAQGVWGMIYRGGGLVQSEDDRVPEVLRD